MLSTSLAIYIFGISEFTRSVLISMIFRTLIGGIHGRAVEDWFFYLSTGFLAISFRPSNIRTLVSFTGKVQAVQQYTEVQTNWCKSGAHNPCGNLSLCAGEEAFDDCNPHRGIGFVSVGRDASPVLCRAPVVIQRALPRSHHPCGMCRLVASVVVWRPLSDPVPFVLGLSTDWLAGYLHARYHDGRARQAHEVSSLYHLTSYHVC